MLYSHVNTEYGLNAQPLFPIISTPNSDLVHLRREPSVPPGNEYVPISAPTQPAVPVQPGPGFHGRSRAAW